jgi:hypothetical protein
MEYLAINGGRFFFIRILNVIRYYCVYFCLLLSLFVPQKNFSQQNTSIHFSHITLKEGLCGATVIKIYQDKEGYLWFCTTEGLQRYDGKNFKTFFNNPANKNSLPNDFVTDIKEDKFGRYWIIMGSHNGVCIYNPSNETFTQINLKKDSVEDGNAADMGNIIFSADSNFMLITSPHGLYKFNVSTLKYKRFLIRDGLLNNWVDELYPIGYNLSLVATRTGLQIYNEAKDSFYNETNAPI